jgi:hypothetical protein
VVVAAGAATVPAGAARPASVPPWTVKNIPLPVGAVASALDGVSCASKTACVAVGTYAPDATTTEALSEVWLGTAWQLVLPAVPFSPPGDGPPNTDLAAVSCRSARACTAVGYADYSTGDGYVYVALAEFWNGTAWSVETTPDPVGAVQTYLNAVSCSAATSCMAAGDWDNPAADQLALTEQWDGQSWQLEAVPRPAHAISSGLAGVSCVSPDTCTAVGQYATVVRGIEVLTAALAVRWNGSAWSLEQTPAIRGATSARLLGVSCPTATACTAVGSQYLDLTDTLAESWHDRKWVVQTTPNPGTGGTLDSVSCRWPTACTAMTYGAEVWNGTTWTLGPTATLTPGDGGVLAAVSCPSSTDCTAVGSLEPSFGQSVALIEGTR